MAKVVVTGAASGIGRAIALRLAHEAYDVVGVDLDAAGLGTTRALTPDRITTQVLDLRDANAVARELSSLSNPAPWG